MPPLRTAWLKESLASPAICVEFDCVRNKKETVLKDGTTFAADLPRRDHLEVRRESKLPRSSLLPLISTSSR